MNRVNVFVRRQRIKKLEKWTMRAIIAEGFFIALYPSLAAAAVLFGTVTWFLRLQIDTKFKMRSLPFDVPVALFAFISAISVFCSSARDFPLIYHFFAFVGIYGLTYILIGQNIRTQEQMKSLVKALSFSALLVVLWGYFQYIFGIDTVDMKWVDPEKFPELRNRVFSTLENPNVLAGYLDVFICLALGVLAKVSGRTQKLAMIIAIVMLSACLAMTYSRGAYFTILIIFIVYGVIQDWRILVFFILVTAGLFYYNDAFVERLTSIFELTDSSQGLRVGIWVSTIAMIADHPFIGIGWGAFLSVYPHYDYYLKGANVLIYHAHNIYLHYAAEIGIVGAMAFFWAFFGTMLMTMELGQNERFTALKEKFLNQLGRLTDIEVKNKLTSVKDEVKNKYLIESGRLDRLIGLKENITDKMADESEKFMNWISFNGDDRYDINNGTDDNIDDTNEEKTSTPKVSLVKKVSLKKKTDKQHNSDMIDSVSIDNDDEIENTENKIAETLTDSDTKMINTEDETVESVEKVETIEPVDDVDNAEVSVDTDTKTAATIGTAAKFTLDMEETEQEEDTSANENSQPKATIFTLDSSSRLNNKSNDTTLDETDDEVDNNKKFKFNWNEMSKIDNRQIADGIKFGIGLAFLSIALNGLTDDLLFNIPTSMLMWLLMALGAAIEYLPEEEANRRRKQR